MYNLPNANGPRGEKAVLSLYFKERGGKKKINKSLQHSNIGLYQKLKEKVFRQRLAAPTVEGLSLLQGVAHKTKDAKLHKFKLGNNKIKVIDLSH